MNTIKLPVSEFKTALTGLGKVVARKSTLPVLQHVRLSRDQQGMITLQATDLDTFVTYRAEETQSGPSLDVLLPLSEISNVVKSSPAKETVSLVIDLKQNVKVRYLLGGSPVEQSVPTLDVKEWPPVPEITQPGIVLDKEFGITLKDVLECVSQDSTRYAIQGACLDVADKKLHYIVGTNGRMLYSANSFCFDLKESVIIPRSRFLSTSDFLDQGGMLGVDKLKNGRWVKLESPRWIYVSKQIEANYPNWKQVIPNFGDKATKIILNEVAVKQLLAVAPKLPGDHDENQGVRLRYDSQSVFIEGRGKGQKEWTSIPIQEAVAKGRSVNVSINREYLLRAMRFGLKMIEIEDELSPVVFWQTGKKMVVMPLKPDPSPKPNPTSAAPSAPAQEQASNAQPTTETTTNERTTMPRTSNRTENSEINDSHQVNGETSSPMKSLADKVEQIRETLKNVLRDLGEVTDGLKQAEKEKKATEKEIEGFRTSLKKIQSFSI